MSIVNEASRSVIGCVCNRKWRVSGSLMMSFLRAHLTTLRISPSFSRKKQAEVYLCHTFKNNQRAEPAAGEELR